MFKKILYIGSKYDHGEKKKQKSLNYLAWYKGFKNLKYVTKGIFFEDFNDNSSLQNRIISLSHSFKPDLIFFILRKDEIKIDTLKELKKFFFTACFFGDDDWRFDHFSCFYSKYFSAVFTNSIFALEAHYNLGQKNVSHLNWGSLIDLRKKRNFKYIYDVSFIGEANKYRKWFVDKLLKNNVNVVCFGPGWNNGYLTYKDMSKVISQSKINLNISNSISYDVRFIFLSIKNFFNFIRNFLAIKSKQYHEIKARNFEICYSGGFQISDYIPFLEKNYIIGKEIICYREIDDAIKLIKYYLANSKEREEIKAYGEKKALRNHSYKIRIRSIINFSRKIKYRNNN
jgi:spore maturation protein CgeB